jgi:ABC-type nitrate/sulfonate/bicarbonate transport system substrate-binding protein
MRQLRIGCHIVPQYAPQFVAEALRAFERRDLEVAFVSTRLGFGAVEALFDVQTDLILGNGLYSVLLQGTSRETLVIADLVLRSYLVLATTGPGDGMLDMKGRLVLVPGTNPATWVAFMGLLNRSGLALSDVRLLSCLTVDDAVDLQRAGIGDFLLLPFEAAIEAGLHIEVSLADQLGPVPWSVYQVATRRRAELASSIEAFCEAVSEGLAWCASHSATEITALLADRFADYEQAALLIDSYKHHNLWPVTCGPNIDVLERWTTTTRNAGLLYSS